MTERTGRAPRGRPRGFDRQVALARAMEVFWARGYEGAQVAELVAAIGIAPPSFYAAFGSKEAAFREAVELYVATVGAAPIRAMEAARPVREAMRALLTGSIGVALSCRPGGCLLILGAVGGAPGEDAPRAYLREIRRGTVALVAARLDRAVREGDLPAGTDTARLAAFYHGILQAISFQARDGATRAELEALVEPSLTPLGPG